MLFGNRDANPTGTVSENVAGTAFLDNLSGKAFHVGAAEFWLGVMQETGHALPMGVARPANLPGLVPGEHGLLVSIGGRPSSCRS